MSFLEPWLLLGLPLILIPIVIHLLNRLRHRTVEWGAMMFLLEATRRRHSRARLRHLLILAMRVAAVAGLVLAVSRPLTSGWLALFGGTADTVIVILDRSMSMSQQDLQTGKSKRSAALRQIVGALRTAGAPRRLVLIESGTSEPQEVDDFGVLEELPETGATDGAANIPALLAAALDYVVSNQPGSTEVWIASDLQSTDWHAESSEWIALREGIKALKQDVRLHLLIYRDRPQENLSVRVTSIERVIVGDSVRLLLSIEGRREGGTEAREVPLGVVLDGARSVVQVPLQGDFFRLEGHQVPIDRAREAGWGKVELPNDSVPRDNVYYFTYGDEPRKTAIVVAERPEAGRALTLAVAPPFAGSRTLARIVARDRLGAVDWGAVALLLWQAPLPTGADASLLERFVDSGGSVIFFPPEKDGGGSLFGCRWGPWREAAAERPFPITSWRDDEGLLRDAASGASLPLGELEVRRCRTVEGSGRALAVLGNDLRLLQGVPLSRGHVHFISALPESSSSNLAREGIVLVVALRRALGLGATRLQGTLLSAVGDPLVLPREAPWESIDSWPEGTLSTQAPHCAGVFRLNDRLVARNRPDSEDSPATLELEEVEKLLSGLDLRLVEGHVGGDAPLVQEVWRALLVAMLVALFVEALLCLPDTGKGGVLA